MKKLASILLALTLLLSAMGCGQNKTPDDTKASEDSRQTAKTDAATDAPKKDTDTDLTPAAVEQAIADAIGEGNYLCDTEIDANTLGGYYGLDMSQIEAFVAKQNAINSINPDTVIVLKVKDGYGDKAFECLNTALSQMVSYIRQYPFGVAKVEGTRIFASGNYVMYILAGASYDGEDSDGEVKLADAEYAKIDAAVKTLFGTLPVNLAEIPEDSASGGGLIVPDDENGGGLLIPDNDDDFFIGG